MFHFRIKPHLFNIVVSILLKDNLVPMTTMSARAFSSLVIQAGSTRLYHAAYLFLLCLCPFNFFIDFCSYFCFHIVRLIVLDVHCPLINSPRSATHLCVCSSSVGLGEFLLGGSISNSPLIRLRPGKLQECAFALMTLFVFPREYVTFP
jgi:hypothetical protein